jgi:hypothetical protein
MPRWRRRPTSPSAAVGASRPSSRSPAPDVAEPVTALVRYDTMCSAIAAAYTVDEVKNIRDRVAALEHYSRQAHNVEAERQCCEIRLRAERKAGELLAKTQKAKGARGNPRGRGARIVQSDGPTAQTLSGLGITRDQSSQWQRLAAVPEPQFEAALAGPGRPTTNGIITAAFPPKPKPVSSEALWLWGRLRDFERDGLLAMHPSEVLATMTAEMLDDVVELAPHVADWLKRIK